MKLKDLLEMAEKEPELLEYTLCLSKLQVFTMEGEEMKTCADFPFSAIASNEKDKEIRFVISDSNMKILKDVDNRVLKTLKHTYN